MLWLSSKYCTPFLSSTADLSRIGASCVSHDSTLQIPSHASGSNTVSVCSDQNHPGHGTYLSIARLSKQTEDKFSFNF
jgi:hypothetical protein